MRKYNHTISFSESTDPVAESNDTPHTFVSQCHMMMSITSDNFIACDRPNIGSANATGCHPHKHLASLGPWGQSALTCDRDVPVIPLHFIILLPCFILHFASPVSHMCSLGLCPWLPRNHCVVFLIRK